MNKLLFIFTLIILLPRFQYAQCSVRDLVATPGECNSELLFDVEINFIYSETSDSFAIRGNGNNYGTFAYTDLPVIIRDLPGGCTTEYEFEVRDIENESCFTSVDLGKICCSEECNIEITNLDVDFCENSGIDLILDVERSGTNQSGFDLFSGSTFVGFYEYEDLPISIENFPSSNTATETIIVCNNDQPECCDTLIIETPCGCAFLEKNIQVIECDENEKTFFVSVDFVPQTLSDSFFLGGNNTNYGTFAYEDLPITIGPLPFSESIRYEFVFLDRISTFCFDFVELGIVNNCEFPCNITNVQSTISDCSDGSFYTNLTFEASGVLADSFSVRGNGKLYGRFAYGAESYEVGPLDGDCETIYEFVIIDDNDEACRDFTALSEIICCTLPCPLHSIQTEINCNNNSLIINIVTNDSGDADSVYVYLNNETFLSIGYDEFPYIYELNESTTFPINIRAVDPINGDCVLEKIQENSCNNCEIGELSVDILGCDDSNANLLVRIDFDHNQHQDSLFSVYIYADFIGDYMYGDLPLELLPFPNPNFEMQFTVIDKTDEECRRTTVVESFTCSTSIEQLSRLGITYYQGNNQLVITDSKGLLEETMLFDLSGKLMTKDFEKVNLNNFSDGLYILYLKSGHSIASEKIFINKN